MLRLKSISSNFTTQTQGQKIIFIFGAPGVGKGTYAKMLKKDLGLNHISTGDQIRKILKGPISKIYDPKLLETIHSIVKSGGLVSDDLVLKIIQEKVSDKQSAKGVILDGFPRTLQQLEKYLKIFPLIDKVINLTLKEDVLIQKLMGRRTCQGCGHGFNVCDIQRDGYSMEPMLPKKEGICDYCGDKLIIRQDDRQEVISSRLQEYESKTKPLLKQFEKMGVLINLEFKRGVHDYPQLRNLLQEQMRKTVKNPV